MACRMSSTACSIRLSWMANPFLSQTRPRFGRGDEGDSGPETYDKAEVNPAGSGRAALLDSASGEGSQRGRFQGFNVRLYFLGMGGYAADG